MKQLILLMIIIGAMSVIPDRDWSIRCGNGMAQVGDSRVYVERICQSAILGGETQWVRASNSDVLWINKGLGDFIYRLHFKSGRLEEILRMERGWR